MADGAKRLFLRETGKSWGGFYFSPFGTPAEFHLKSVSGIALFTLSIIKKAEGGLHLNQQR